MSNPSLLVVLLGEVLELLWIPFIPTAAVPYVAESLPLLLECLTWPVEVPLGWRNIASDTSVVSDRTQRDLVAML